MANRFVVRRRLRIMWWCIAVWSILVAGWDIGWWVVDHAHSGAWVYPFSLIVVLATLGCAWWGLARTRTI